MFTALIANGWCWLAIRFIHTIEIELAMYFAVKMTLIPTTERSWSYSCCFYAHDAHTRNRHRKPIPENW